MRKSILLILILGLLLLIGTFFTNISGYFSGAKAMFKSIPSSNIAVVYLKDPVKLMDGLKDVSYKDNLEHFEFVSKFESTQKIISDFLKTSSKDFVKTPICASLHLISPYEYDYLFHFKASSISFYRLSTLMQELDKNKSIEISSHEFNGRTIFELKNEDHSMSIAQSGQTIICSKYPTLIEEALIQVANNTSEIASYLNSSSYKNKDAAVYLNLDNITLLGNSFTKTGNQFVFDQFKKFGSSIFANFSCNENGISVEGEIPESSKNDAFMKKVNASDNLATEINSGSVPFNSGLSIFQKCDPKQIGGNKPNSLFNKYIAPWFDGQWTFVIPENQGENFGSCLVLACSDERRADNLISMYTKDSSKEPLRYRGFQFEELDGTSLANLLVSDEVAQFYQQSWLGVINNTVVFGNSISAIESLVDQILNQQSIRLDERIDDFLKTYASGTNVILQSRYLDEFFKLDASPSFEKSLLKHGGSYSVFSPALLNIDQSGNINGQIHIGSQNGSGGSNKAWNVALDAPVKGRPTIVKNKNTGVKEILIKDNNNALYSIGVNGQKNWKIELQSPLLSEIYPVDFYQNGEQQLVFNTRNHIFVIDKYGEALDNFPLRLSTEATNGLLFIPTGTTPFLFVPCINETVYGYDLTGRPLSGWQPNIGLGLVEKEMKFLNQKNNKFIVAVNNEGTLSFVSVSGEIEFVAALESKIIGELEIDRREGFDVVIATCENGKTFTVNQEGSYFSKKYLPLDAKSAFLTENVMGGASEELIFTKGNVVSIFNTVEKIFDSPIEGDIESVFICPSSKSEPANIGLFSKVENRVYMLNATGEIVDGFPIKATSPFVINDLFDTGEKVVIAGGNDNNVFAYRLN